MESADAFTRFYLKLIDHAVLVRDISSLRTWSDQGCIGCRELIDPLASIFAADGSYEGDFVFKNVLVDSVRLNKVKGAEVRFRATIGRHAVRERRGASPTVYPGETIRWRVALLARNGQWIMYEIEDEAG